jgi:hypothetical protein
MLQFENGHVNIRKIKIVGLLDATLTSSQQKKLNCLLALTVAQNFALFSDLNLRGWFDSVFLDSRTHWHCVSIDCVVALSSWPPCPAPATAAACHVPCTAAGSSLTPSHRPARLGAAVEVMAVGENW